MSAKTYSAVRDTFQMNSQRLIIMRNLFVVFLIKKPVGGTQGKQKKELDINKEIADLLHVIKYNMNCL